MPNRFLNNITINDEYTLPTADGSANQVIATDGSGNLSFVDQSGGASLSGGAANKLAIWSGTDALTNDTNLHWDTSNDRLGIGTDSPTRQLTVFNSTGARLALTGGSSASCNILFGDTTDDNKGSIRFANSDSSFEHRASIFNFKAQGSSALYINSSGNVGINTTTPDRPLVVSETRTGSTASDAYTAIVKSVQSSGASPNPGTGGLKVQYTSSSSNVHAFGLVAGSSSSDFLTTGPMHFYTNSDLDTVSATGFAMQLDTSQRLTIGSMTASQKLNVNGNVTANRYYGNGTTAYYLDPNDVGTSIYTVGDIRTASGFTSDGLGKLYAWRAVDNTTSNSTNYVKIARLTGTASGSDYYSDRCIIELAGRSTSYSNNALPAMGYIVAQLQSDGNWDVVYYNHHNGSDEVVDEVGVVQINNTQADIYVRVGTYAEVTASAHISDGYITVDNTRSGSAPSGYSAANAEYKVWNSGNDGAGSLLDADKLDAQEGSYYLNYNNLTNKPTILTGNGTSGRIPIYNGTTSFTTDSGFTYSSNKLGIDHTITSNGLDVLSNTTSRTLELGDVSGNDDIHEVNIKVYADNKIAINDDNVTVKKPKFTSLSAQNSEATALMINGSNVVGTRELGSNAFNSTSFLTSESDTLATVTGRGASTTTSCTFNTITMNTPVVGSSNKIKFANNDFIRFDDANGVGRFHFDCDGSTNNASVQAATFVGALSGNASTASSAAKWTTARTLSLTGDVTGSVSWDGSANASITTSVGDADTVDGHHANRFFRRIAKASAAVGPGWMTVAENVSGRKAGEIIVTDADSGDHAYIRIEWMRSYSDSNFTVLNCGGHANRITGARVLYNTSDNTYGGKKLQVYVTTSSTYEVNIYEQGDIDDYEGHSVVTPVIQNTISGYALHGRQLENLDTFGFAAEEGILSGGDLKVLGTGDGIHVDSTGHASLRLDRASTSYDNNILFMTGGGIKWRLWQDGTDDQLMIRDNANSYNSVVFNAGGASGNTTFNNDVHLGTYSGTAQSRLFLNGTTANKQAKIQCTNGNLHIDSEDGHSLYLNYYEGTTDNVIIGNGNGGSSGTILKSTGRVNVGEHLIAASNVYAGGANGFVFGSSISEGEYIQRNGNNIEFVAGGAIKFDVHATNGVHVRNGSTYYAQISNTGEGRFGGDVTAYYNFSDKRLKTNIKPTIDNLDKVLKLNPVEYNWKEGYRKDKKEIGLIAQEVEKIIPEVVRENKRLNDDTLYKQVDYEHLVSTLIGAVQEQQKQIDELKAIINGSS